MFRQSCLLVDPALMALFYWLFCSERIQFSHGLRFVDSFNYLSHNRVQKKIHGVDGQGDDDLRRNRAFPLVGLGLSSPYLPGLELS